MMNQPILDRALSVVSAALVPVGALLVHHGVISSQDAVDVGAVWAAAVGAFHGGTAVQRARGRAVTTPNHAMDGWIAAKAEARRKHALDAISPKPAPPALPLTPYPDDLPPAGG